MTATSAEGFQPNFESNTVEDCSTRGLSGAEARGLRHCRLSTHAAAERPVGRIVILLLGRFSARGRFLFPQLVS